MPKILIYRILEHLQQLAALLALEKQEDYRQYTQYLMRQSMAERQQKGSLWYPLAVKEQGFGMGDRPFLVVERTKFTDIPHQFSAGKGIHFFTQQPGYEVMRVQAIVQAVGYNFVKIVLYEDDFPEWTNEGKIGIELIFDERPYREMEKALKSAQEAERNRFAKLRDIICLHKKVLFNDLKTPYESRLLNVSQVAAINKMLAADELALLHGPPGTGKTTTLVKAMHFMRKVLQQKILACAPSNTAADLLCTSLAVEGLNVLRIGNLSRMDEEIVGYTLEGKMYNLPESKEIKRMKQEAENCRKQARKFVRTFNVEARENRKRLYQEAREISNHILLIEHYLAQKLFEEADVVISTLVGASDKYLEDKHFDVLCIDEAGQALEPSCWIALQKADKWILAGDPFQLPPTVKSREAEQKGFNITLLERCIRDFPEAVSLLKVQYRMNEKIMGFSNQWFYNNELEAHEEVSEWQLNLQNGRNEALEFIDTAGCGFEEQYNPETKSIYNPEEYGVLWRHLDTLMANILPSENFPQIGIISPYKEQATFMEQSILQYFDAAQTEHISVNTIDAFQGQERDIIYVSLVRSNEKQDIGFLKDYRRLNVAFTRAKKKLVVIGDSTTLAGDAFFEAFIDYCQSHNAYFSAWEYM